MPENRFIIIILLIVNVAKSICYTKKVMFRLPKTSITHFAGGKLVVMLLIITLGVGVYLYNQKTSFLTNKILNLTSIQASLRAKLVEVEKEINELKNDDQYKKNKKLQDDISNIEQTYKKAVSMYEKILDFQGASKKSTYTELFAKSLKYLSERNYASAAATLSDIDKQIADEKIKIAATFVIPDNVPVKNAAPSSGYSRQKVSTDIGDFLVDIVTADLNSTRVIVDSASDSDCKDSCPVLPLGSYVSRSGAYAGINGSYFCPAEYPTCAGKTNSFDTLLMNKNKKYLNSDNNVYSNVPAVIFSGNSARFVGASQEWGRDTSVDSVLANQPLLVSGGKVVFGGGSDPKQGSKGSRSFVGSSGSNGYIGVVHNATVAEVARVLAKMGIQNALNLDSGGSTALWSGGYKVGPGRNLPNALLFVRK